jgi:hypothetical protein
MYDASSDTANGGVYCCDVDMFLPFQMAASQTVVKISRTNRKLSTGRK